ncbi:MAG TPA: TetR family transcriptional regulator C-terminal domain-containing protein [Microthrixaceae bacterium]|nr:TetR family transcriptional regulator C-terminal domain-containing protein [Microthrixaceae bacterium]
MPKKVDHDERRKEIAGAVGRLATENGLQGVSFREVAAEAGVSVALVQHYFGTKENLLVTTLDLHSAQMAERIAADLVSLGADAEPLDRIRAVTTAFLPTDAASRDAMLLYLGFGAAALTDDALRSAAAFRNGTGLMAYLASELTQARDAGRLADGVDPEVEGLALVALLLGLSLSVLLDQVELDSARAAVDGHLGRLARDQ